MPPVLDVPNRSGRNTRIGRPPGAKNRNGTARTKQNVSNLATAHDLRRDVQHLFIPKLTPADKRRRLSLEADIPAWIMEMCGPKSGVEKPLTRDFTAQDLDMIKSFSETLEYGGSEFTLACRGGGKTSRLRECILHGLASGKLRFEIYFAANQEKADDAREFINHVVTTSEPFAALYPEIALPVRKLNATPAAARTMRASGHRFDDLRKRYQDVRIQFEWSSKGLRFPDIPGSPCSNVRFMSYGLERPPRGLNKRGTRPTHCSIDDPDTEETTSNGELAEKLIDFIKHSIGGLSGEGETLGLDILCTLSHKGEGVAYRLSGDDSPFVVNRHVFMQSKPARLDLWRKYIELRQGGKAEGDKYGRKAHAFYVKNFDDMNVGAVVANHHRFDGGQCPDGTPKQLTAIQAYFDDWADKGERFCQCELDNERLTSDAIVTSGITAYHISHHSRGDFERLQLPSDTDLVVRGMDIRKTALHHSSLAAGADHRGLIVDYNVHNMPGEEVAAEQAEHLILDGLRRWHDETRQDPFEFDDHAPRVADLTLIDKGWIHEAWTSQPVETFCMEQGLRRFMPAKGMPKYTSPKPGDNLIIGDNWHMKRGEDRDQKCTCVYWNHDHWNQKVHERFLLKNDSPDSLVLFDPPATSPWEQHNRFAQHLTARIWTEKFIPGHRGIQSGWSVNSKRDHWFDACAMMLVAQSVECWFRENLGGTSAGLSGRRVNLQAGNSVEIGAR